MLRKPLDTLQRQHPNAEPWVPYWTGHEYILVLRTNRFVEHPAGKTFEHRPDALRYISQMPDGEL